ncbi:hypothetical protein [Motilimonas cestriensis]|uniref:hypothetical protein n=1 Tax=Motilimonas cestriensis TaxID=2742685 RepID=UPI003DA65713
MLTEVQVIDLAKKTLSDFGSGPLPKLKGTHFTKKGDIAPYTKRVEKEDYWSVWFYSVNPDSDDIITVIVYPDGNTEIPYSWFG